MSRNFDIARSRLRNGWCEFSARLLSHLPQVWADAFGPRRCSARVRSTQRSETPARPPAHAGTLVRARRTWFYTCSGRAASQPALRSSLFGPWHGQATENRTCFTVNRNSRLLNAGAFPAIGGLPVAWSPRARCKGEFGRNREFYAISASKQGGFSGPSAKEAELTRDINDLWAFLLI